MKTLEEWKAYYRQKFPGQTNAKINKLAQKAFDSQQAQPAQAEELPTFGGGLGPSGPNQRGVAIGFGLTDANGNSLVIAPARIPAYLQELLLTNPKAFSNIQTAVYKASGRKYSDANSLGNWLGTVGQNQLTVSRQNPELSNVSIEMVLNAGIANRASNPLFAAGAGKNVPTDFPTIASETTAQNKITDVWKKELGREPTPEELAKETKKLQKAQEKNPTKQTYEVVNGKRVQKTLQGLDVEQYLTNQARKLPEYSEKTAEAARIAEANKQVSLNTLARTATANGLDLQKNFGDSVQEWTNRIAKGESIEIFKNLIRQTAKTGMPDVVGKLLDQGVDLATVYEPYKRIMASVLEMNPETITLDNPTLRGAIGQDKEMTLYDFQRSLRKDPRWQYTNNAREEISNSALQVLRNFGFQG